MRALRVVLAVSTCVALGACASGFVKVAPTPPAQFERLGKATGESCGMLGLLATAYNFVPMGINGRVDRAYAAAVASVPGASGLVDVTISENWYWVVIGTMRCTTVTGEAIK